MLTNLLSWLRDRVASLSSFSGQRVDSSQSSTCPEVGESVGADLRSGPIATLQVHGSGLHGALDSVAPFYELTDVESAMRHEGAIPPGHYVVFRDTSGRLLLQEQGLHRHQCASSNHLRRVGKTLCLEAVQSLGSAVQCSLSLLALVPKSRA